MDDKHVTDPKENPTGTGHLPGAGEVGVDPVTYHDPVTADTDDDPGNQPSLENSDEADQTDVIARIIY